MMKTYLWAEKPKKSLPSPCGDAMIWNLTLSRGEGAASEGSQGPWAHKEVVKDALCLVAREPRWILHHVKNKKEFWGQLTMDDCGQEDGCVFRLCPETALLDHVTEPIGPSLNPFHDSPGSNYLIKCPDSENGKCPLVCASTTLFRLLLNTYFCPSLSFTKHSQSTNKCQAIF